MRRPRGLVIGVAASAALAMIVTTAPAHAGLNPTPARELAAAVSTDNVMKHLKAFESIADANDGNRAAGTSGYEASARYLEDQLARAGYETERQYFSFLYEQTHETSLTHNVGGTVAAIESIPMEHSPGTPEGGVTGRVVQPTTATGCVADDWAGVDAIGRIALVSRGGCAFSQKSLAAAAAGAEALVIYNNAPGTLNGILGGISEDSIPTTGVTQAIGTQLLQLPQNATITFVLVKTMEERDTFNVLAETRTGRTDNVVLIGSRLDGVPEGPSINVNGSGSAATLETAIQLARAGGTNNKVRFAWWGGEELGQLGSRHYVRDLDENDPEALENLGLYVNYDVVASPNYVIGVRDANESTYDARVPVPAGSIEAERVFTHYFDSIGQPWVDTAFAGRSEGMAFIELGIPTAGLFSGVDGSKTAAEAEMFGGTAWLMYDPNNHTLADDLSNVNVTALGIMSKAIGFTTGTFAYDTSMVNGKSSGTSGKPHPGMGKAVGQQPPLPAAKAEARAA